MELTITANGPYLGGSTLFILLVTVVASLFLAKPEGKLGSWWLKVTFIAVLAHLFALKYSFVYGSKWWLDGATIYIPSIFLGIYIFRQAEFKGIAAVFAKWLFIAWVIALIGQTALLYTNFQETYFDGGVMHWLFENPGYEVCISSVALYLTFLFPKMILGVRFLQIFLICQVLISYSNAILFYGQSMFPESLVGSAYSTLGLFEYDFFRGLAVPIFLLHMFLMVNSLNLRSFKDVVKCYVGFKGHLNRSAFWLLSFAMTYINIASWTYLEKLSRSDLVFSGMRLGFILFLVLLVLVVALNLWIHVALVLKRLHNLGRTAKVFWFYLIPVVGQLGVLIYVGFFPGVTTEDENRELSA